MPNTNPARVGQIVNNYCGGAFGRDFWGPARIEAIGSDWIVVRRENGRPDFASFDANESLDELAAEWEREEAVN